MMDVFIHCKANLSQHGHPSSKQLSIPGPGGPDLIQVKGGGDKALHLLRVGVWPSIGRRNLAPNLR